jgi:hypothetical protein
VHTQPWASEAGGHEAGGRVMEPRKRESGGPQAMPQAAARESRRRAVAGRPESWRRQGEGPGSRRGLRAGQACRGVTRERGRAHGVLVAPQGEEGRPVRPRLPALGGGSCLAGDPCLSQGHQARRALQGSGAGQGVPNDSESGSGQSARTRVPRAGTRRLLGGQGGHRWPRAPLAGRRSRASRFAGRTSGSDAGSPNRSQAPPEQCRTGHTLSSDGVSPRVARARLGVLAGSLSAALSEPCAGGGAREPPRRMAPPWTSPSGPCTSGDAPIGLWRRPASGDGARRQRGRRGREANPAAKPQWSSARWG